MTRLFHWICLVIIGSLFQAPSFSSQETTEDVDIVKFSPDIGREAFTVRIGENSFDLQTFWDEHLGKREVVSTIKKNNRALKEENIRFLSTFSEVEKAFASSFPQSKLKVPSFPLKHSQPKENSSVSSLSQIQLVVDQKMAKEKLGKEIQLEEVILTIKEGSFNLQTFVRDQHKEIIFLNTKIQKLEKINAALKKKNEFYHRTFSHLETALYSPFPEKTTQFPSSIMLRLRPKPLPIQNLSTQAQLIINQCEGKAVPYYDLASLWGQDENLAKVSRYEAVELYSTGYGSFDNQHFQGEEFQGIKIVFSSERTVLRHSFRTQSDPLLVQKNTYDKQQGWIITSPMIIVQ